MATGPLSPSIELDPSTIEACRAGDRAAMRAFVARYQRTVFAFLSRTLGAGPHVEDIAQEVFLRAFRALPRFDAAGPARPSTWLLTIAARLVVDERRRRRFSFQPLDPESTPGGPQTPESESRRGEIGRALARAAGELSDDQCDVGRLGASGAAGVLRRPNSGRGAPGSGSPAARREAAVDRPGRCGGDARGWGGLGVLGVATAPRPRTVAAGGDARRARAPHRPALACLVAATSSAGDRDTPAQGTQDAYGYKFVDDPLTADGLGPLGAQIAVHSRADRSTLIRPRTAFVIDMLRSVERL